MNFEEFIAIKGIKAQGNQLTTEKIKQVNLLESLPYEEPEEPIIEEVEVVDEEIVEETPAPQQAEASEATDEQEQLSFSLLQAKKIAQEFEQAKKLYSSSFFQNFGHTCAHI